MGIQLDNVSIFKKRMGEVKIEDSKHIYQAPKDIHNSLKENNYKGELNDQEIIMDEGFIHNGDADFNL